MELERVPVPAITPKIELVVEPTGDWKAFVKKRRIYGTTSVPKVTYAFNAEWCWS